MAKEADLKNIYVRAGGCSFQVKLYANGTSISATFDTLEEAQTYRDTIRANKTNDKLERSIKEERVERLANKSFTLHDGLEKFKAGISEAQASKPEEIARIGKMQRMPIAKLNFYSVRPKDVYALLENIGGTSENRRHYALLLSKVFKKAKEWGYKVENPVLDIKLPSKNKPRERRLSADEYNLIKENISADVLSVIIIALETAARKSEILNSIRCDLDIEKRTLRLRKTKNGEQRMLPLSTRAIEILKEVKEGEGDRLFGNINASKLRYEWEKMSVKTGLLDLHFHDLRHEATSRLVERGRLNLLEVASVTGHKDLAMLKRYTHLIPTDIAKKLD